ncbi:putative v-type c subunit family protein [Diaporthe ampelina]|uniref:Putative v-type c subunit family protein n=1 Tax=Diaporthe ampelina TaxID=1214573 RepID=A0A0G2FRK1_9PEZI|nr:putative v-type c subunit family protein [Diaporthe ampelina]
MVRSAEKQSQVIDLPFSVMFDQIDMKAPLVPITHPRKILEGLGNIIAKVEVDGEPCPASMELQTNIPRLMEARRALPLGGGGEWGAKASLLSLDPKTSHTPQSEADELDKFMRSFNGEQDAKYAIAQPGDYVQFFVERDAKQLAPDKHHMLKAIVDYPPVSAEGIYVSSTKLGPNTKMDVPGATVTMATVKGSDSSYRPYVRPSLPEWGRSGARK